MGFLDDEAMMRCCVKLSFQTTKVSSREKLKMLSCVVGEIDRILMEVHDIAEVIGQPSVSAIAQRSLADLDAVHIIRASSYRRRVFLHVDLKSCSMAVMR